MYFLDQEEENGEEKRKRESENGICDEEKNEYKKPKVFAEMTEAEIIEEKLREVEREMEEKLEKKLQERVGNVIEEWKKKQSQKYVSKNKVMTRIKKNEIQRSYEYKKEFEILTLSTPEESLEKVSSVALSKRNINKNNFVDDVPFDKDRLLNIFDSDRYFNASWVSPTIGAKSHYIIGQIPCKNTSFDFLKLLITKKCEIVITIDSYSSFGNTEKFPYLWGERNTIYDFDSSPSQEGNSYEVRRIHEFSVGKNMMERKYNIYGEGKFIWAINIITLGGWGGESFPNDHTCLYEIYKREKSISRDYYNKNIMVLSERPKEAASLYVSLLTYLNAFSSVSQSDLVESKGCSSCDHEQYTIDVSVADKIYIKEFYPSILGDVERNKRPIILSEYFLYVVNIHPSLLEIVKKIREERYNACPTYEHYYFLASSVQYALCDKFKAYAKKNEKTFYTDLCEILQKIEKTKD